MTSVCFYRFLCSSLKPSLRNQPLPFGPLPKHGTVRRAWQCKHFKGNEITKNEMCLQHLICYRNYANEAVMQIRPQYELQTQCNLVVWFGRHNLFPTYLGWSWLSILSTLVCSISCDWITPSSCPFGSSLKPQCFWIPQEMHEVQRFRETYLTTTTSLFHHLYFIHQRCMKCEMTCVTDYI